MPTTLHLMTQRDVPYGGTRESCEYCGVRLRDRPDSFWRRNTWTDDPDHWKPWPADTANIPDELIPCSANRSEAPPA